MHPENSLDLHLLARMKKSLYATTKQKSKNLFSRKSKNTTVHNDSYVFLEYENELTWKFKILLAFQVWTP